MHGIVAKRLIALAIDWLLICGYLIVLAMLAFFTYLVLWDRMPDFSHMQSQILAFVTSVVPVVGWFSWKESRIPFASTGKIQMELTVAYKSRVLRSAVIRNILKFLPWQLAHMGVIYGIVTDFESPNAMMLILISIFLAMTYVLQVVITPSHRHFPDIISGAHVERLPG